MQFHYRWINAIGLILVLVVNGLAEWLPLGGKTTGEISAQYPVLILPAPYAFIIWSLIYALLLGFVVYSFSKKGKENTRINVIGPFFAISCLLNCAWILTWHYGKLISSVFVMLALLLSLIIIYTRVRRTPESAKIGFGAADRWLVQLPFSLYLAWICVASILNIASALYAQDWNGWGLSDEAWTVIMLSVASLLAIFVGWRYRDPAFIAVFIWAFIAIIVKQQDYSVIVYTAIIEVIILAAVFLYLITRNHIDL